MARVEVDLRVTRCESWHLLCDMMAAFSVEPALAVAPDDEMVIERVWLMGIEQLFTRHIRDFQ